MTRKIMHESCLRIALVGSQDVVDRRLYNCLVD
jgi:hypothetical protein